VPALGYKDVRRLQHADRRRIGLSVIVGQQVTQAANDKQQLVPLLERLEEQSGQKPKEVVADNGARMRST
jgi:hypothetical protein